MLVVPAKPDEFEVAFSEAGQTREHAVLLRNLGVKRLVVAVNKMDTVRARLRATPTPRASTHGRRRVVGRAGGLEQGPLQRNQGAGGGVLEDSRLQELQSRVSAAAHARGGRELSEADPCSRPPPPPRSFVPVSGIDGLNLDVPLSRDTREHKWYTGPCLLEALGTPHARLLAIAVNC